MPKKTYPFGTQYQGCHGNLLASRTALAGKLVVTPQTCCHYADAFYSEQ